MKKWKIVNKNSPPINEQFWGYDVFYKSIHICEWDGKNINSCGYPTPICADKWGNDYSIEYWTEMEKPPLSPNVELE